MGIKHYTDFLETDDGYSFSGILMLAFISGIANTGVLALINMAADDIDFHSTALSTVAKFMILVSLAIGAEAVMIRRTIVTVEFAIHRARCTLIKNLQQCEYMELQAMGRGRLNAIISNNLQTLSASSWNLAISAKMLPLVVGTSAYMLYLSPTAFMVMAAAIGLIAILFFRAYGNNEGSQQNPNAEIYDGVSEILSATRESKLNATRARVSLGRFQATSERVRERAAVQEQGMAFQYLFSQASLFLLIGSMIFVVPAISETFGKMVQESTTAILFLIGPVGAIVSSVPILKSCTRAIDEVTQLQSELERYSARHAAADDGLPSDHLNDFREVQLQGLTFSHQRTDTPGGFMVGPLDLTIARGTVTFITGGNGSGKSTLLHLLTTLYPQASGQIAVDGKAVAPGEIHAYRQLFATVLSDLHLGRHLDSLDNADLGELKQWLKRLEVDRLVQVQDRKLSTVDLSTGQKKRVALAVALAEKRPILILDEWAADQDPVFRKKFYREILPDIADGQRTVVAVTHDDAYFDMCDQSVNLRDGRVVSAQEESA